MKVINLFGRLWRDKVNGTTYHDVEIVFVTGKKVIEHRTTMSQGGSDYYIQAAAEWLNAQKLIKLESYPHGGFQPLWRYCKDNNIVLITHKAYVLKREMKQR